jgi:hypothetical protein
VRRLLPAALALALSRPAQAADTIETFDPGPSDVELYAGVDGIGASGTMFLEHVVGFGIAPWLSALVGASVSSGCDLEGVSAGFAASLFGTPLDTDHVDLDLVIDVSSERPGLDGFSAGPALELNVDLEPDLALWGAYLRTGVPAYGRRSSSPEHPGHVPTCSFVGTLGTYLTFRPGHQILLEAGMTVHLGPAGADRRVEVGGVAVGYNVEIDHSAELILEVFLDIPQAGEGFSAGIMLGVIGTRAPQT